MSDVPEGYKMSEVGVIPEEWEIKDLGDAAEVVMGQSPVGISYNRSGTGAPLINGPTEFTEKYPIKIQWTSQPTKFCKKGDVLLCVRGSSTGRINISDDEYCIGRGVAAIRAKSCADKSFITFQVDSAIKKILALTTGSTFPNIDGKSIRAIQFPLPPFPEQQAIASALSDVDVLITALEQLITKRRNIKQGAMQQLIMGEKRLPGFGGEWEVKKLGEICNKFLNGGTPSTLKAEYWNGNIPWISGADIVTQKITTIRRFISEDAVKNSSTNIVEKGNLLLVTRTGVGKMTIAPFDIAISQDLTGIYIKSEEVYTEYVFHYFDFNSTILKSLNQGTSISGITRDTLTSTPILLPLTIEEQQAIAQILSDMDTEIESLEQKRDKYKAIKQGMMQELLTGKTRLV
jgi:type I restriction enzyme, S subunit